VIPETSSLWGRDADGKEKSARSRERALCAPGSGARAGYEILTVQTSPSVRWLNSARKDLVAEYEALDRPEEARKFAAEASATTSTR
jgi:hypothetical protein